MLDAPRRDGRQAVKPFLQVVPANDVVVIGGHLSAGGDVQREFTIFAYQSPGLYFCDLNDDETTTARTLDFASTSNGMNYNYGTTANLTAPLGNGDVTLTFAKAGGAITCTTTIPASAQCVNDLVPGGLAPTELGFAVFGLALQVDYVVRIRTN